MTLLHFQRNKHWNKHRRNFISRNIPFAFHFYSYREDSLKIPKQFECEFWFSRQYFGISVTERYLDTIRRNDWNKREGFGASTCLLEHAQSFSKSGRRDSPFFSASRRRIALCASEATKECSSTEWRLVLWSSLEEAACPLTGLPRPA